MRSTLTLTTITGFVSFLIAYFLVPGDLKLTFSLLALVCVIAGYPSGTIASGKLKQWQQRMLVLGIGGVICVALIIANAVRVRMVSADTSDIVILAVIFAVFFFVISFLLPIAGVSPKPPKGGG